LSFVLTGFLGLAVAGCGDGKPTHGEDIAVDASKLPTLNIPTPTVIEQARLASNAALTGIDGLAGGAASLTAEDIEKRLKAMNFGVDVQKGGLYLFDGVANGQSHVISVAGARSTISAIKGYSADGRNILESIKIDLILDHVESVTDEWSVVIGELPPDIANLPYILQPSFGMMNDDRGLAPNFVTDRLSKLGFQFAPKSDRPASDRPYDYATKCYARDGGTLPAKDCKDVVVEYSVDYFLKGSPERSCHRDICKLDLFIKDQKLASEIYQQTLAVAIGKAVFVEKFGEPEPDKK